MPQGDLLDVEPDKLWYRVHPVVWSQAHSLLDGFSAITLAIFEQFESREAFSPKRQSVDSTTDGFFYISESGNELDGPDEIHD